MHFILKIEQNDFISGRIVWKANPGRHLNYTFYGSGRIANTRLSVALRPSRSLRHRYPRVGGARSHSSAAEVGCTTKQRRKPCAFRNPIRLFSLQADQHKNQPEVSHQRLTKFFYLLGILWSNIIFTKKSKVTSCPDSSSTDLSTSMSVHTETYRNAYMTKNQKAIMEYADKNYPYKHKFTAQKEIYGPESRYSDKTAYQYALVTSLVKPNQYMKMNSSNRQFQSTRNQPIFRYYLYDRLNDKTYSSLGNGSSLVMWAFKSAIKKLNDVK